jgi:hypothetical protein
MCGRYSIMSAPESKWHLFRVSIALPIAALLLAACAAQTDPNNEAWWDGCQAGRAKANSTFSTDRPTDDTRYSTDAAYRQAWDGGFTMCFSRATLQSPGF